MRRVVSVSVVSALVMALAPASALARHHHRRHHRHHAVVHRQFGHKVQDSSTGQTPSQSSPGTAGTVASFTNGVLTLTLNDGSTVSGAVTDRTDIKCEAAGSQMHADGDGGGDNSGSGDEGSQSGGSEDGDGPNGGDEQGEDQGEEMQNCSSANLTPTTTVQEAELSITSAGAVWNKVELIG